MTLFFEILLYFTAFGSLVALFASAIGAISWLSIRLYRTLTASDAEAEQQTARSQEGWNPNQWKRAGQ